MKSFIIHTNHPAHLHAFYSRSPQLLDAPFKELEQELANDPSDAALAWGPVLADLGHEVREVIANDAVSQCRWVHEKIEGFKPKKKSDWAREVVIEQLRKFKPDVLVLADLDQFDMRFVDRLKQRPQWIIGWSTSLKNSQASLRGLDLFLSPHASCLRNAWRRGVNDARIFQLGFPRFVAESVFQEPEEYDVVYAGCWRENDDKRTKRIAALAKAALRQDKPFKLGLFLDCAENADLPPAVRKLNQGTRHGLGLYRVLRRGKIAVNEELPAHLGEGISPRVYETTGLGVFTLASQNEAVVPCFVSGREIVLYEGSSGLIEKIDLYLSRGDERNAIARAGQERCLTEHSMEGRLQELIASLVRKPGRLATKLRRLWHRVRR